MMKSLDYIKKLIQNNKEKKSFKLIIFLVLFVIYLTIYYFDSEISLDEIWNYGFAYNISKGLIPYLDFNMIQTPLYAYLLGSLISIFGNSFMVMVIFNSFLSAVLHFFLIKKYGYKTLILFPCLIFSNFTCYNFLSLVLFVIFLNIDEDGGNEYLKGFLISLLVFTKQTTGGLLLIVSFILSKDKKKYLIGFLPLCFFYLDYLIITNSVYQFFDYCLFSLVDFTSGNSFSLTNWSVIFYIILVFLLIIMNINNKFKDRQLVYILTFQIMAVPLFDFMHILVSVIPFLAYLLNHKYKRNLKGYVSLIVVTFYISFTILFTFLNEVFISSNTYYINNSFLYGKRVSFKLQNVHNIMNDIDEYSGYRIYHLYEYAYLVKLENNQTLDRYDLNLIGNLGYHGEDRCIEEIKDNCSRESCLIIIDHDVTVGSQISRKINNYVKSNYRFNKSVYDIDFYTNN